MRKSQNAKLKLSRETLHELGNQDLKNAAGGFSAGCATIGVLISDAISCWYSVCIPPK